MNWGGAVEGDNERVNHVIVFFIQKITKGATQRVEGLLKIEGGRKR